MLCPEVWNFSPPACNFKFRRGNLNELKTQYTDLIDFHYFNYLVNNIDFFSDVYIVILKGMH
jgi:hypothetical protein